MLARRVIAVAADKALGKQLAIALGAAGGAVESHASVDDLGAGPIDAALVVIHLDGPLADDGRELLSRLSGDTRVIAILPRGPLATTVDVMLASERVAGVMVAEDLSLQRLSAMATRVLAGDIFGLDKLIPWGTQLHSFLVGDYQEKSRCIAQVAEFAERMGVRRKYRESIEQCLDEMLMNALYDAPIDEQGRPIFAEIPTRTRISLRVDQKVVVQYACDGTQFAIAVRDAFGTLERATVLRYLHKCLHSEQQIDRKVGGAGLGLYLMASSASTVYFNVLPGVATEAVCTFELDASKVALARFGFFTERIDAAGRLAAGPSRRLPTGASHPVERRAPRPPPASGPPRALVLGLVAAIVATLALVVVAAWPRVFSRETADVTITTMPAGATIEVDGKLAGTAAGGSLVVRGLERGRAYPVVARLDGYEPRHAVVQPRAGEHAITLELEALAATVVLETQPPGAAVTIDGEAAGTTPLTVSTLAPGRAVSVAFARSGYQPTTVALDVPGPGKELRLIQPLAVAGDFARVKLVSEPPGAQVVQNGQLLAGVLTPADVLVEAGKPVRFTLTMQERVPAEIEPFTPARGVDGLVKTGKLVAGVPLRVRANVEATASITDAPHCQDLALPLACVLAPGTYTIELALASSGAAMPRTARVVTVADQPRDEAFELGYVEAAPGTLLRLAGGKTARRIALEAGPRRVTLVGAPGSAQATRTLEVTVRGGATVIAR